MSLMDRIGVDTAGHVRLEDALDVAAKIGLSYVDVQLDTGDNKVDSFDDARCAAVKAKSEKLGIACRTGAGCGRRCRLINCNMTRSSARRARRMA
ncbi:hypothetical protein D9M72_565330 [compost metagenome]